MTEAIRLDPKNARSYGNRGWAHKEKGEHDKAIADFTEVIRLNPKDAKGYWIRGLAYSEKGEQAKADEDFARARKLGYTGK